MNNKMNDSEVQVLIKIFDEIIVISFLKSPYQLPVL